MSIMLRYAKSIIPAPIKNQIKRQLGRGSLYEHSSFDLITSWPDQTEQSQNWAHPSVIERYMNDFRQFDVASSLDAPIVKDNLTALAQTELRSAKLLDVGCANGIYCPLLAAFPSTSEWEYYGVDVSPTLIEFCQRAHPIGRFSAIADASQLPFEAHSFDIVLASGILFAIKEFRPFLKELHRVSNNFVILSRQPVWKYHATRMLMQRVVYAGRKESHPVRFFNRDELDAALDEAGFEVVFRDYSEIHHHVSGIPEPAIDLTYLLKKVADLPSEKQQL